MNKQELEQIDFLIKYQKITKRLLGKVQSMLLKDMPASAIMRVTEPEQAELRALIRK